MRNWLVHAIVKKNISPSPLKLPIHERGLYEYRGRLTQRSHLKDSHEGRKELLQYLRFREVYIYLRKSLVIRRPFFYL